MQVSILREVVSTIAGERAKTIIDLLIDKKNVNEFLIAKKMKLTINQTRNILYKLGDEGLVSFIRKKDAKKGGWYTYFWTLNPEKGMLKYKEGISKSMDLINNQIRSKKTERFFFSPNCSIEFNEETALLNEYTCPECGEILQLKDNSKEIIALEKEIIKFNGMLASVDAEIKVIQEKDEKIKFKKIKVEEKKKKEEREERKKQRAKEKKKLIKDAAKPKKPVAKKFVSKKFKAILGLGKKN